MTKDKRNMYHRPKRRLIARIEDLEKAVEALISSHKDLVEAAKSPTVLVDIEWSQQIENQAQETLSGKA